MEFWEYIYTVPGMNCTGLILIFCEISKSQIVYARACSLTHRLKYKLYHMNLKKSLLHLLKKLCPQVWTIAVPTQIKNLWVKTHDGRLRRSTDEWSPVLYYEPLFSNREFTVNAPCRGRQRCSKNVTERNFKKQ
jgi:hypothetical protein